MLLVKMGLYCLALVTFALASRHCFDIAANERAVYGKPVCPSNVLVGLVNGSCEMAKLYKP